MAQAYQKRLSAQCGFALRINSPTLWLYAPWQWLLLLVCPLIILGAEELRKAAWRRNLRHRRSGHLLKFLSKYFACLLIKNHESFSQNNTVVTLHHLKFLLANIT
ncbi:hypothetical protein GNE08_04785 [Trichormus variabilis ARAD]|nr:hypothetical protein [Trichormus variabilis]MBC1213535.1 hypothetical protein [Trichormus variabilis ARAD]MBC1269667.1 hypothetical protein [Trichormus variabilis FSR]MBC1300387.1 hypothetical protein [Trichormus variabilis N2B]MBD2381115.1 hypothetical protein [Trichormus variabilis FACHB-319]QHD78323.1 hypothetical protein GSQ19_00300 [Trichormus variabilis 0441]